MSTQVLNHRFVLPQFNALTAPRVVIVYCELCRKPFATAKDEARHPGNYISLWRGAAHRPQLFCDYCQVHQYDEVKAAEENREIVRALHEEQTRFHKPREVFRASKKTESAIRARRCWADWKVPLMEAFKERGTMTIIEMREVTGLSSSTNAAYFRRVLPIVTVEPRHGLGKRRGCTYAKYGLSSAEVLPALTPPQDETGQFMREAADPRARVTFYTESPMVRL